MGIDSTSLCGHRPFSVFLAGTEFFRTGGIQQVNRLLLKMLLDFAQDTPGAVEAFSYGDPDDALPAEFRSRKLQWHGSGRGRVAMATRMVLRAIEASPHLLLITHVNLLPLAQLVRGVSAQTRVALLGHGVEVWKPLARRARAQIRAADAIVAPSTYTAEQLIATNGAPRERVSVIAHGLPPGWTAGTPALARAAKDFTAPLLLTVARLSKADVYKGVGQVIAAMPAITAAHPGARLIVAGDGEDRPRLEELARQKGATAKVEFRGEVSESALRELYARSSIFVLPSKKEGFGLVFAEAMAFGVPVVAARAGGAVDVVTHGETGLLVSGGEEAEIAGAVSTLLCDSTRCRQMGNAARHRVQRQFMYEQFAQRWRDWMAALCPEAIYLARHAQLGHGSEVDEVAAAAC
jgi:glycosyltransferase involved in cell wall biosynthesis